MSGLSFAIGGIKEAYYSEYGQRAGGQARSWSVPGTGAGPEQIMIPEWEEEQPDKKGSFVIKLKS